MAAVFKKIEKRYISYVWFWQNIAWWCKFDLQTLGLLG